MIIKSANFLTLFNNNKGGAIMNYCSFFGVSAPQLVLLDLNDNLFKSLVRMLNNTQDLSRLNDLMTEFNLFKSFLTEQIIEEYENPDIRRKARQCKLSREHYATGKRISKNMLLPEEEIVQVEQLIANARKHVAPYIMREGKRVDLSEPAVAIVTFLKNSLGLLTPYIEGIHVNATKELTVFNRRLEDVVYGNPESLKYRYMGKLSQAKSSAKKANAFLPIVLESIRKDIDILLNTMKEVVTEDEENTPNGIVVQSSNTGELFISVYPPCYPNEAKPLILKLAETGLLPRLNMANTLTLANLYCSIKGLDVDMYNLKFGLDLTLDEYEEVFQELDSIGLIGLNNYAEQFLFDCLNSLALVKDLDATITNPATAKVVLEMDRAVECLKLNYGEAI